MKPRVQLLLLAGLLVLSGILGTIVVRSFVSKGDRTQAQTGQNNQQGESLDFEMTAVSQAPPPMTLETLPHVSFTDVSEGSRDYDAVRYMLYYGYLQGVEDETFAPAQPIDRATMVTVLHRISKEKPPEETELYADVSVDEWYADAVAWAYETGIVQGLTEDSFGPLQFVTRSQLATVLSRFAAHQGLDVVAAGDLSAFSDREDVAEYAREPMAWAIEQ